MKKPLTIILTIVLLLIIGLISLNFYVYSSINYDKLNFIQQKLSNSILDKFEAKLKSLPKEQQNIVGYEDMLNSLNYFERRFAEKIFSIDPKELGFKGPFYSRDKATGLHKIENIVVKDDIETGLQYYPEHAWMDYLRMMDKMYNDIRKKLFIDSGYRSPGKQGYLFFFYLVKSNDYNLKENAKWIALPGFSEHGNPKNTAIDFVNENGINGFSRGQTAEDFERLTEYEWLLLNANNFNFYLSYPKNNKFGVAFEPWHWHWEKKVDL